MVHLSLRVTGFTYLCEWNECRLGALKLRFLVACGCWPHFDATPQSTNTTHCNSATASAFGLQQISIARATTATPAFQHSGNTWAAETSSLPASCEVQIQFCCSATRTPFHR